MAFPCPENHVLTQFAVHNSNFTCIIAGCGELRACFPHSHRNLSPGVLTGQPESRITR